jgi:hypothetical protein
MDLGREYTAELNLSTAITAQVDIFEILAATGKPLALLGFELFQTSEVGDAQEEQLELVLKYVTGSPTSGSGGPTAPTFRPKLPNDTGAGATIEHGNTTKLTGGTSVTWARLSWNVRGSLPYVPIGKPPVCAADENVVLELVTTPADSITKIVGLVEIAELV